MPTISDIPLGTNEIEPCGGPVFKPNAPGCCLVAAAARECARSRVFGKFPGKAGSPLFLVARAVSSCNSARIVRTHVYKAPKAACRGKLRRVDSSWALRGVASVKLTEMPCHLEADEECASCKRRDAADGSRIEVSDAQ